ncbi:hypothetical protein [Streptomyces sp. NBC_01304]|uniref:hypothetical protein n=1 Tax=Streptomyces sp. NBC_01304 TaxID=2903818 RepID=UPI002E0E8628|nr:hypothetical protein OG430_36955 [Streptomyces sp. NBC_01304]
MSRDGRSGGYLDELAALLRDKGLPDDHVAATVGELAAHLEESGGDAEAEFGPAGEFAAQLAPEGGERAEAPEGRVETWRWTADTFVDEALLNRFGDEGWEVDRVDALGRFVSHRDPEQPQRWEYRRELITRGREGIDEKLAPDGWEECGTWVVYAWFKRPRAASLGPAAQLTAPVPPAPARSSFFSRRFYALIAAIVVGVIVAGFAVALSEGEASTGLGFATGLLAGAAVPLGAVVGVRVLRERRRR